MCVLDGAELDTAACYDPRTEQEAYYRPTETMTNYVCLPPNDLLEILQKLRRRGF